MLFNRLYYQFKPLFPQRLRVALRRWRAARRRAGHSHVWPIDPNSARPPAGWQGWPDGKQFAFVLTHDVEGTKGLQRCKRLADFDAKFGFRASFNFVPEGEYAVPASLRDYLSSRGCEVGVHDLHHNGKLYRSRPVFRRNAARINRYVREWGAAGFRSGFMHHNLDWLHDLEIQYDSSTFDTDPFEPQPDAVHTIFPFWVPNPALSGIHYPDHNHNHNHNPASDLSGNGHPQPARNGYVELPYTLPQDFTLFVVFEEQTTEIWKRKVDWIAEHGGMVLVDVHPDYINFDAERKLSGEFSASLYEEFLDYVRTKYNGRFWHALPRDVAEYVRPMLTTGPKARQARKKIWIDLDNTPHVPFFKPIIRELERKGFDVVLTAREAFQVCELAERAGLTFSKIGWHYGKNPILKVLGLIYRAVQLLPFALREKPTLGLSHGARSQIVVCNLLRIPTILILDYEHASTPPLVRPTWEIAPASISNDGLACSPNCVRNYSGIKEDVYAPDFRPDPSILSELGLSSDQLIVTVRPPATEAHYHNPESEILFARFMERVCAMPHVKTVLLPRNKKQETDLRRQSSHWFAGQRVIVPPAVVDGLNLLWHSDFVVSGGGTMNREAAALGVPVYSIFRGKTGAVDRQLQKEGRLTLINDIEEVEQKILFRRRDKAFASDGSPRTALKEILQHIEEIAGSH